MTLDEAIVHAREVAERNRRAINFESEDSIDDDIKTNCLNCAEEHEQLVAWLEELKAYRNQHDLICEKHHVNTIEDIYNKAIDDFASELKSILPVSVHKDCSEIDYEIDFVLYNMRFKIDNIADQLRQASK